MERITIDIKIIDGKDYNLICEEDIIQWEGKPGKLELVTSTYYDPDDGSYIVSAVMREGEECVKRFYSNKISDVGKNDLRLLPGLSGVIGPSKETTFLGDPIIDKEKVSYEDLDRQLKGKGL
ncbi:MAG: hypothetical protein KKF48_04130 [Nanoarchaeota archaeon]|nr:hypothetical protein [Nanoarchaeota archaeon]MBU1028207.1 hypothetical protein [Nanoarchaeota archaeon]